MGVFLFCVAKPVVGNGHYGPHYYLATNGSEEDAEGLIQVKMAKCYVGFDFGNTWVLDKYLLFPYPQLKRCVQVRTESIEFISLPDKLSYIKGEKLDFSDSMIKSNIKIAILQKHRLMEQ